MRLLSLGSSPSQMIAVWLPRLARCRSMQLAATLSVPSSNQRTCRLSGSQETSLTLVNGVIQSRRAASLPQNPSGSVTDSVYRAPYSNADTYARLFQSSGTITIGSFMTAYSSNQLISGADRRNFAADRRVDHDSKAAIHRHGTAQKPDPPAQLMQHR